MGIAHSFKQSCAPHKRKFRKLEKKNTYARPTFFFRELSWWERNNNKETQTRSPRTLLLLPAGRGASVAAAVDAAAAAVAACPRRSSLPFSPSILSREHAHLSMGGCESGRRITNFRRKSKDTSRGYPEQCNPLREGKAAPDAQRQRTQDLEETCEEESAMTQDTCGHGRCRRSSPNEEQQKIAVHGQEERHKKLSERERQRAVTNEPLFPRPPSPFFPSTHTTSNWWASRGVGIAHSFKQSCAPHKRKFRKLEKKNTYARPTFFFRELSWWERNNNKETQTRSPRTLLLLPAGRGASVAAAVDAAAAAVAACPRRSSLPFSPSILSREHAHLSMGGCESGRRITNFRRKSKDTSRGYPEQCNPLREGKAAPDAQRQRTQDLEETCEEEIAMTQDTCGHGRCGWSSPQRYENHEKKTAAPRFHSKK